MIRVSNCRTGEVLEDDELVYISEEKHQELIRSEVLPGDVLLTKAGHILGYTAVLPESMVKGNITSHLVSIRPSGGVIPKFLATYLTSSLGIRQIYRWGNKATRPELNTDEVRKILVPLPSLDTQRLFVAEMEAARAARKQKLAEADALLAGLDAFVLEQLGLKLPKKDKWAVFAVRWGQMRSEQRLNSEYFHPERMSAIRAIQNNRRGVRSARLADIADFVRDLAVVKPSDNYIGLANVQSHTGELVETDDESAEGQCFVFGENDVLFARLRPYLNKVHRAERAGVSSTEFHVIRVRPATEPRDEVLPDYLATILRSSLILAQTRHMMTGNTHPRLTNEDVVNLVIPIPADPTIQRTIATEVSQRRKSARQLRETAEAEWEAAKANFERALLGE